MTVAGLLTKDRDLQIGGKMSDDKNDGLHSDIYSRPTATGNRPPRLSILKFGSFGDALGAVGKIAGQGIMAWILFTLLLIVLLDPASSNNDEYFLATLEIVKLVCITISVFLAVRVLDDSDLVEMGLKLDRHVFGDILAGFAMAALVFGCNLSLGRMEILSVAWATQSFANVFWNTVIVLLIFVFVGWSEELLSRGFHLRILSKGFNRPLGIILSSVIFSFFHLDNPGIGPEDLVFIFLFGIIFSLAFLRTGQLWLAMGIHAGWDFFAVIFTGNPISGLRLYHLMDVRLTYVPAPGIIIEILELVLLTAFIYLYTARRKTGIADW